MTNEREPKANLAPKFPLSVLLVEDNPADAELCLEFLSKAQFDIQFDLVTTAEQVIAQIRTTNYDIVLADYNLGSWTGMDVLNLLTKETVSYTHLAFFPARRIPSPRGLKMDRAQIPRS